MGIRLEHLQAHRDNVVIVVNLIDTTVITTIGDTTLFVMDVVDTIVQPVVVRQPMFSTGPNRFATA